MAFEKEKDILFIFFYLINIRALESYSLFIWMLLSASDLAVYRHLLPNVSGRCQTVFSEMNNIYPVKQHGSVF